MNIQCTVPVLSNEERPKALLRAAEHMIARHGGTNLLYVAAINFDSAMRLLMYQIDDCRDFDALHTDPGFRPVRRAALTRSQNRLGRGRGALSGAQMCDRDSGDRQ